MTIANQLAYLHGTKVALRDAMIEKGLDVPFGTPFSAYAALIESLNCSGGAANSDPFGDGSGVIHFGFDGNLGDTSGKYPITGTNVSYEPRGAGQALVLSRATRLEFNNPLQSFDNTFTISMHYKYDPVNSGQFPRLFNAWRPNAQGVLLYITNGKLHVEVQGVTIISSESTIPNTWEHVAVTYNAGALKLYRNSVLVATGTAPASFLKTPTATLNYLAQGVGYSLFVGSYDNFRFLNKECTASEVSELNNEAY